MGLRSCISNRFPHAVKAAVPQTTLKNRKIIIEGISRSAIHQNQSGSFKKTKLQYSVHTPDPFQQNQQLFKIPRGFQCPVKTEGQCVNNVSQLILTFKLELIKLIPALIPDFYRLPSFSQCSTCGAHGPFLLPFLIYLSVINLWLPTPPPSHPLCY